MVGWWLAPGAGQASASHVSCGVTVTTDTVLDSDLVDCPNNGVVIGADDISLDLGGHVIDGDRRPFRECPRRQPCDTGVVNDGHDGVTVSDGSVREFEVGVVVAQARHARVLRLSSSNNRFVGIGLFESARSLVRDSSATGSTDRHDGVGMVLFRAHHVQVVHNAFRHNAHVGIVSPESNHSLMERNVFSRNDDEAILVEGGNRNQVTRNRFVRNGAGITLGLGSRNMIDHNRISGGRDGIRVEKGHDNLVAENVVVDARRVGITLGIRNPFIGGARNFVLGNLVRRSRGDGFVVLKKDAHSLLSGNIAKAARDDGFDVESRSATLASNRAVRNGDLGIEAVFGVLDGGRNNAHGNGNPLQCTNIACS